MANSTRLRGGLMFLSVVLLAGAWLASSRPRQISRVHGERLDVTAATPTAQPTAAVTPTSSPGLKSLAVFSLQDGERSRLYAYDPDQLPARYYRLTGSDRDALHPAVSPDGSQVVFTSRQASGWDLYLLQLSTGNLTRLTNNPHYDGHPSWSPDGQQLVFESLNGDNLDIFVLDLSNPGLPPLQLTYSPKANHSPAWSPTGQQIAFFTIADGLSSLQIADLSAGGLVTRELTEPAPGLAGSPAWSPEGGILAWSAEDGGGQAIYTLRVGTTGSVEWLAGGSSPCWSPDGTELLSQVRQPNGNYLERIQRDGRQTVIPLALPGQLNGLDWSTEPSITDLSMLYPVVDSLAADRRYQVALTPIPTTAANRGNLVALEGISATYPFLADQVDESFQLLRAQAGRMSGWDVLGSLEQAYRPLSAPGDAAVQEDWLRTGRAFTMNSLPLQAGWMVLQQERFNGQVYWRVFVRTRLQDGSQGVPLRGPIWSLDARSSGDPGAFEDGGRWESPPDGYWVDLTALALQYDWERLPALHNWRTYYPGARFNQWALTGGLSWEAAMAGLYPPEAISTPTAFPTHDPTRAASGAVRATPAAKLPSASTRSPGSPLEAGG